jgi:hypothetical protein
MYLLSYLLTCLHTYLFTAIEFELGGSSTYSTCSTDQIKRKNTHKRNNKKTQTIQNTTNTNTYYQNTHTIVKTHPHIHTPHTKSKLKQPQYKIHTTWISHNTIKYHQSKYNQVPSVRIQIPSVTIQIPSVTMHSSTLSHNKFRYPE